MAEKITIFIWLTVMILMFIGAVIQNRNGIRRELSAHDIVIFVLWPIILPLFPLTDYIHSKKNV